MVQWSSLQCALWTEESGVTVGGLRSSRGLNHIVDRQKIMCGSSPTGDASCVVGGPWRCARRRRAWRRGGRVPCPGPCPARAPRGGGKPASEREQTAGSATQPCHPDVLWLRTGVPVHSQASSAHAWGVVPYSEAGKDCADGLASTVQCVQYSTADWLTATSLRSLGDEWQDGCR